MATEDDWAATRREKFAGYRDHVRLLWTVSPGWSTICLLCAIVGSACSVATMVSVGQLIGALNASLLQHEPAGRLWTWLVVFAGAAIASQITGAALTWCGAHVNAAYRVRVDALVTEAGLHPANLAALEDERFAGELSTLPDNSRNWLFRFGLTGTWELLSIRLTAVGSAVIVVSWRWWVAVCLVACFAAVSRVSAWWIDDLLDGLWGQPSGNRLRASYVGRLMTQPYAAKEIRLFGLADWLSRRYALLWHAFATPFWRRSRRKVVLVVGAALVEAVAVGGALGLLAYDTYHGWVAIAAVTTLALAVLGLEDFGPQGDPQSGLVRVSVFLRRLFGLRTSIGLPARELAPAPPPPPVRAGAARIDIHDLSFTYPTRDQPILAGLTLTVPAGQSLAVVGVNGSGKSTLMKLVAGLYQPDHGTIRVDGKNPFADPTARGQIAVVFQDFVHYPLSLRDNVGFGAMGRRDDQSLLDAAMHDAGGASVIARLDGDWGTVLSQEFDGGTDLSGGQWQRVALARALAAVGGGAGVLVLDEPTAALDVRAEAEIFDRFLDVTRGVTTILVSHRLSTVRRAERIVVLDGSVGRIVEDGSHEELMALGGEYAQMFGLQAMRFGLAGDTEPS